MYKIFKYELGISDEFVLNMPKDATILTVQTQKTNAWLWVLVNTKNSLEKRTFKIYGTGNAINIDPMFLIYIGTYQEPHYVWHLFEKKLNIKNLRSYAK